jgi:hypothetical protein
MMELLNTLNTIKGAIPGPRWIFYAALRLGSFLMIYLTLIGLTALILPGPTFMLFVALIPFMIFVAIRVSGAVTDPYRPKSDYRKS